MVNTKAATNDWKVEALQTPIQHELVGNCWLGYQLKANLKTVLLLYSDELANGYLIGSTGSFKCPTLDILRLMLTYNMATARTNHHPNTTTHL